jgi:glutamate dehydrogenase
MAMRQSTAMMAVHQRHLVALERSAGLVRELEGLPSDDELDARGADGNGLTRPELAVILAYTKNQLTADILASPLPDSAALASELVSYVPAAVRERFVDHLARHPLRREIIATVAVNRLVNRAGMTMVHRFSDETAATPAEVLAAHRAAWDAFGLERLWEATVASADQVPADVQITVLLELRRLAERACRWVLRHRPASDPVVVAEELAAGVSDLLGSLPGLLTAAERRRPERERSSLVAAGVPDEVARMVSLAPVAVTSLDQIDLAARTGRSLLQVAELWFVLGRRLDLGWLREQITALPRDDHWRALARSAARDDLLRSQADLVEVVLDRVTGTAVNGTVDRWLTEQEAATQRYRRVISDVRAGGHPDLAQLSVALRELRNLIHRVRRFTGNGLGAGSG